MNGLELVRGTLSKSTSLSGIKDVREQIEKTFSSGVGVVHAVTRTSFVTVEKGQLVSHDGQDPLADLVQEIRIFNVEQELHLWRLEDATYAGRLRQDGQGEPCDHVDAVQILFGTRSVIDGQWTRLSEERYADLVVPGVFADVQPESCRVAIRTRNYVRYSSEGVAGYEDSRFVSLDMARGEKS